MTRDTFRISSKLAWVILLLVPGSLAQTPETAKIAALPAPVSDNAVVGVKSRGGVLLFSFMGMGSKKTWDAVTNAAFYIDPGWEKWYPVNRVPGPVGRLAAAAASARGSIFIFGGYVVDERNRGIVVPDANIYDVDAQRWSRGADVPLGVAGSVAGVYHDRYIYLIGGLANSGPAPEVQIYDVEKSRWLKGTPMPGTAVFGAAGALVDDTIISVDGAYRNPAATQPALIASDQCWMGKIDHHDPTRIDWTKLPNHPGTARFGIAAGGSEKEHAVYFTGGSDGPDGFTGMGFDGKPAEPSPVTFAFSLHRGKWSVVSDNTPNPTMNNHGLLVIPQGLVVVGGMEKGQEVSARVTVLPLPKTK